MSKIDFFLELFDPSLGYNTKYQRLIGQINVNYIYKGLIAICTYIATLSISHYFLSDLQKTNVNDFFVYRLILSSTLFTIAILSYLNRKNGKIIQLLCISTGIFLSFAISYQSTLYIGDYLMRPKFMVLMPAVIYMLCFRSIISGPVVLLISIYITSFLWNGHINKKYLISDIQFAILGFIITHFFWRFLYKSKISFEREKELEKKSIEEKIKFHDEVCKFISPVLVNRLDDKISQGKSIFIALDEVTQKKLLEVSVIFSDLRNYSQRSMSLDFIENELVPSSSKVLDICESTNAVGRQIGDNVMAYFDSQDPEENILRAILSGMSCSLEEFNRIKRLGRIKQERFFIITHGKAFIGDMGTQRHRDITITGDPVNLASRIDSMTKEEFLQDYIQKSPCIILSQNASDLINSFADFDFDTVSLERYGKKIRSYENENNLFIYKANKKNIKIFKELAEINNISVQLGEI